MSENIILSIGSRAFSKTLFAETQSALSLRQLVVYRYRPGAAVELLLAESANDDENMHRVIGEYVRSLHLSDPLKASTLPLPQRTLNIHHIEAAAIEDEAFRNSLYRAQHMASKSAVVVQRPQDALVIGFFRGEDVGKLSGRQWQFINQSARYIAAAVERHFEISDTAAQIDWVARLENIKCGRALSRREVLVCSQILDGYFNEAIGLNMGISVHSVITYRRRAFGKLGISTQNELFTLAIKSQMH